MSKLTQTEMMELATRLVLDIRPHKYMQHRRMNAPWRLAVEDARTLVFTAAKLHRIAEMECNGIERYDAQLKRMMPSWTEEDDAKAEKQIEKLRKRILDVLHDYNCELFENRVAGKEVKAEFGGDPRGMMVLFHLKTSGPVRL